MSRKAGFSNGFTLIELMVSVSVAAILLTTAVPGFQEIIKNNRMTANINEFVAALNLARSEAVNRGILVTVCKGAAAGCSGAARWESGWIVFTDGVGSIGTVDAGSGSCSSTEDCVLRVYPALSAGYTLNGNANVANEVTYNAKGMSAAGTLVMCDDRGFGDNARAVSIVRTGHVQALKATQPALALSGCQI